MARQLRWTQRAITDLDEILAFIARDAPANASAVHGRFLARIASLPAQPGQGRHVPEYDGPDEIREVFVHSWRVIYRTTERELDIVAIVHSARLLRNAKPIE